jgi:zinc transporter 5/7
MTVQTFYGIATGSLGLLSDSVHMLFDCLALAVGLCAAVMSKWPPSTRFPYGLGRIDTLAGFANGIFLMLISIEIVIEAFERLYEGVHMQRIGELLTVSTLGLVVNLVGIFAFGHGDHHHGHSHSHSHSPSPSQHDSHNHAHETPNGLLSSPSKQHSHSHSESHSHSHSHHHGHGHHHDNSNMRGIYLHILADALGSLAVVISTILIHYFGWYGFDPLASVLIAVLIFVSAIPLVLSSAQKLLLAVPDDVEYSLRETLAGVSALKGVDGYHVPRFWLGETCVVETSPDTGISSSIPSVVGSEGLTSRATGPSVTTTAVRENSDPKVNGVIHIVASPSADAEEVRQRVASYFQEKDLEVTVQVEKDNAGPRCWCRDDMK